MAAGPGDPMLEGVYGHIDTDWLIETTYVGD
jgi:hypothetical protein